jgi:hypothetical protein
MKVRPIKTQEKLTNMPVCCNGRKKLTNVTNSDGNIKYLFAFYILYSI